MCKKTVSFNKTGVAKLPNDKPVVYKIQTQGGKNNYTGIAQRGRVQEGLPSTSRAPGTRCQV